MDLNLQGKVALIIASSQGLGKGIAAELVKEGANVMLTGRDQDKLQATKAELEQLGTGQVAYHPVDITNPTDIQRLVQVTRDTFGTIDILVNNAGGPRQERLNSSRMSNGRLLLSSIY